MPNKRNAAVLALVPAAVFVLSEVVTGNLLKLSPAAFLLGLGLYYLLFFGGFVLTKSTKWSFPILGTILYVFAVAEYFVISFRERPAMIWDVLALRTAMTVSANYKYAVTPQMAVSAALLAVTLIFTFQYPVRISVPRKTKRYGAMAGAFFGGASAFLLLLFGVFSPALQLDVHMWDPIGCFETKGVLLSTVLSAKTVIPQKPVGVVPGEAEEILEKLPRESEKAAGNQAAAPQEEPENIICIMNESFSDLRLYNGLTPGRDFETDREFLSFFDSLDEDSRAQKGTLYVPVFGAMTANSEYEFLTGNTCAFAPQGSVPYQFYVRPGEESLASIFKAQGYRTVAMHPYPGYNWNRTEAYGNMGFDQFLDQAYYETLEQEMEVSKPRGYLSDRSDYDGIIRQLESKAPGEKLFLFNVTMQNHGGFEVAGFGADVHVTELMDTPCAGDFPKADQYLTLMRMSDDALRYLLEYCEGLEEPTMVVLFGDHQPSVETEFFEAFYESSWGDTPEEKKVNSFKTPYLIWTNYERDAKDLGDMSAFMLGNAVLSEAGISPFGYRAKVQEVQAQYRAVHSMGLVDRAGNFKSVLEMKRLDADPLIRELHVLQYDRMFGE